MEAMALETILTDLSGLGIMGLIAGLLFKKFLEDDKVKIQQRKEEVEYFRTEIAKTREIYQIELKNDREIYIESIRKLTDKIEDIEESIEELLSNNK